VRGAPGNRCPYLDQWKQNPQGIVKPAVVQVDFTASQAGDAADNAGVPAVAAGYGA